MPIILVMKIFKLSSETVVKNNIETVFQFFSDPANLMELTPDNMKMEILNDEPIKMQEGAIVKLKMKLFNIIPMKWETKIEEWNPPHNFVDTQPKGPYRYWKHTHRFEEVDDGDTVFIRWDSITLKGIGMDIIIRCENENLDWQVMTLNKDDIEVSTARDSEADVDRIASQLKMEMIGDPRLDAE